MQQLDDSFTAQRRLFAAVYLAEPAFVDQLAQNELSKLAPGQVVPICHFRRDATTCDQ
ncbi:MAG TPA: hypothetical protein VHN14_17285 [Kofleriaceae bacterium]|nr:hypothetical protein [Kofleriaceae bacterium]